MKVQLTEGAMVIAEQNLQLLEGCVDRLIGIHGGEIKGAADSLSLQSGMI